MILGIYYSHVSANGLKLLHIVHVHVHVYTHAVPVCKSGGSSE